jgi:hypothetical protein
MKVVVVWQVHEVLGGGDEPPHGPLRPGEEGKSANSTEYEKFKVHLKESSHENEMAKKYYGWIDVT